MRDPVNLINSRMDSFTVNGKKIARYILLNRDNIRDMTQLEIENKCGVGRTSFRNFLAALNYSSFHCLKMDIELVNHRETIPAVKMPASSELVLDHRGMDKYLKQLFAETDELVKECETNLNGKEMENIVRLMTRADRIWFYGTDIFEEWLPTMVEEFTRFSSKFEYVRSLTKLKTRVMNADDGDLFFLVDYGGSDRDLRIAARGARFRNAMVAAITHYEDTPLTAQCMAKLYCCEQKEGHTDINLPVLASVQYLLSLLLKCYARFNPGECQIYGKVNLIPTR